MFQTDVSYAVKPSAFVRCNKVLSNLASKVLDLVIGPTIIPRQMFILTTEVTSTNILICAPDFFNERSTDKCVTKATCVVYYLTDAQVGF